jgi:hypothetical protein
VTSWSTSQNEWRTDVREKRAAQCVREKLTIETEMPVTVCEVYQLKTIASRRGQARVNAK